ncbi:MAG: hypothetical protein WAM79_11625 [Candidatus Sulfotelmatobacter sp.]
MPKFIPGFKSRDIVYPIVESVDFGGYSLILAATPDCAGQHVCSYGNVIRTRSEIKQASLESLQTATVVRLRSGVKAYFHAFKCGASCGESSIAWTEGAYSYAITLKAASKSDLIAAANSATERSKSR